MVEVKFPVKKEEGNEGAETYGSDKTNDASGKYLISNLRHLVGGGMGETQLELIRDVFTPSKGQATNSGEVIQTDNRKVYERNRDRQRRLRSSQFK